MNRGLLFLLTIVSAERRSVQQSVYVSRKSRSNSQPIETGYVYNQINNHPGTLAMFGNDVNHYNSPSFSHHYGDYHSESPYSSKTTAGNAYHSHDSSVNEIHPYTPAPMPSYEYLKAKAEAKYETNFLPSKIKSDAMYEKLKSIMHYKYPDDSSLHNSYDALNDYNFDEDDVRTSSRSSYGSWPYFYHSPYEYEAMKNEADQDKVKDKRFIVGPVREVIPVHEDNVDDIPHSYHPPLTTTRYNRMVTTDNPVYGDQPFFSFVLNDYFDKGGDDDSLSFKGLDWGKEFDHERSATQGNDYLKRDRRLGTNNDNTRTTQRYEKTNHNHDSSKMDAADSTTEKGYSKKHEFNKHEKGDQDKEKHQSAYENAGNRYSGFKDFADSFANRFGGEEHKKDANYILSKNQDKGEKKKGFRRVYHKDEYQEEDEFYDNSNSSVKALEKGGSSVHQGGSEAILKSHATAAIGNDAGAYNNAGMTEKQKFENNHQGNKLHKGYDSDFKRYRDVAHKTAQSNGADYKY